MVRYPYFKVFLGRLIYDNALIAFECMHSLSMLKDLRGEFFAYKLDLAKACDHVD